jgi:carbonic anhydrase
MRRGISTGAIAIWLLATTAHASTHRGAALSPHAVLRATDPNGELVRNEATDQASSESARCSSLGSLPQGFYSVKGDVEGKDASAPHSVLAVYALSPSDSTTCLRQREVSLPPDAELLLKDSARGSLIFKASGGQYGDVALTDLLEVRLPDATVTVVAKGLIFNLPCDEGRRLAAIRRLGPHAESFEAAPFQLEIYDFPINASPTSQVVAKGTFYSKFNSGESDEMLSAGKPWDQEANLPLAWTQLFAWRDSCHALDYPNVKGKKVTFKRPESPHGHWSYAGATGPQAWGKLDKDFAACSAGLRQSPIDLTGVKQSDLPPLQFRYQPSAARVLDTGHSIEVEVAPGNELRIGKNPYQLMQFHFHSPAEHTVEDKQFPLEAHFVHRNAQNKFVVVALLFNVGDASPLLDVLLKKLPAKPGGSEILRAPLDASQLLPKETTYYAYSGSLTTPPCTEDVTWVVLKSVASLTEPQLDAMRVRYPHNARPLQPPHDRGIEQSK